MRLWGIGAGVLILSLLFFWTRINKGEQDIKPEDIFFECVNPKGTYYHRFVFRYRVPGPGYHISIQTNSFSDPTNRQNKHSFPSKGELAPEDSVFFENSWPYPGTYTARLIKKGKVLKEVPLKIGTNGWDGILSIKPKVKQSQRLSPILVDPENNSGGRLVLPDSTQKKLDNFLFDHYVETNYFFVKDFDLDLNRMSFEIALRNTTEAVWNPCRITRISLLSSRGMIEIPIIEEKCLENGLVIFSDHFASFRKHDILEQYVSNSFGWDTLRIHTSDMKGQIFKNDELLEEITYQEKLGELDAMRFKFSGTGSIDYIKIRDENGNLIYNEEFSPDLN